MKQKKFSPDTVFESNTTYVADRETYHIFPNQTDIRCWWTTVSSSEDALCAAFVLRNLENVVIDLGGARLVFHGRVMPFAIYDCKNVTVKNFSIDYDRPFFTQGRVIQYEPESITIEIPEEFVYRVSDGYFTAVSDTWEHCLNHGNLLFCAFSHQTGQISPHAACELGLIGKEIFPNENPPMPIRHITVEEVGEQKVKLSGFSEKFAPEVGDILVFTHEDRRKCGFLLERSCDTNFKNIRLLHVPGLGVIANLCHNLTFRRFDVSLDSENGERAVSINADALHGFHCTGKIAVEDCCFEGLLDDAFNFHGNYITCLEKLDAHKILLHNDGAGLQDMEFFLPGDRVSVLAGHTSEVRNAYTVKTSELLGNNDLILEVEEDILEALPGDLIENLRMPEILIRGCSVKKARGGIRLSSGKKTLMEQCRLEHSYILFTGDTNYWFENTGARDAVIRRNELIHTRIAASPEFQPTENAPYYHKNIRIEENIFRQSGKYPVEMNYVEGFTFLHNTDGNGHAILEKDIKIAASAELVIE